MCLWFHFCLPNVLRILPRCCSNAMCRPFSAEEGRRKAGRCEPPSLSRVPCVCLLSTRPSLKQHGRSSYLACAPAQVRSGLARVVRILHACRRCAGFCCCCSSGDHAAASSGNERQTDSVQVERCAVLPLAPAAVTAAVASFAAVPLLSPLQLLVVWALAVQSRC